MMVDIDKNAAEDGDEGYDAQVIHVLLTDGVALLDGGDNLGDIGGKFSDTFRGEVQLHRLIERPHGSLQP